MDQRITLNERPTIEPRWLMPVLDFALIFVAFGLGYILRYEWQVFRPVYDPSRSDFLPYLPYILFYGAMLYLNYQSNGLYRNVRGRAWMEEVTLIANGVANATLILLAIYFLLQPLVTSRLMLVYVAGLSVLLLSLARLVRLFVLAYLRGKGIGVQRVLIIGMADVGESVLRTLVARQDLGYKVVGFLDDDPERGENDFGRVVGLGKSENLEQVILSQQIDVVIITLRWQHYEYIQTLTRIARDHGASVRIVPDIFQLNMRQVHVDNLDGIPLLGIQDVPPLRGTNRIFKRALDIAIVIVTIPLWLPVVLVTAIAIKLEDGGNIFYHTKRVGENGREFMMVKFRSMIPDADKYRDELFKSAGEDPLRPKLADDPRQTRIGRIIRRLSIDEFPNFINVVKGEMSIVGPRPPLPDEVSLYEQWHLQRLKTIPGITGLWQVSGRSEVPFDEMCLMDIYYIENWSILFDIEIMLRTIPRVLLRSGAY